jgi:superfamily II DNA or RNA helicase/HKD family nuclease
MNTETDQTTHRYFAGNGSALRVISHTLANAETVRIATAYFQPSGFQCLHEVLKAKKVMILLGRYETGADNLAEVLREFMEALSTGPLENRTSAMEELRDALLRGEFSVTVSGSLRGTLIAPRYLYHHAKIYIADEEKAVVGSSNLSYSGLVTSREAGIVIDERDDVLFFVRKFDEYYKEGKSITDELLAIIEDWLNIHRPFSVYGRSLLELYELPHEEKPGRLPELANYQRPAVSRIIRIINDYSGAFLVASTGLGKTIIAAHVVAYLKMDNLVDHVIVVCPATLKSMWRRTMKAARVSGSEFSYNTLSTVDWKRDREMEILERDLESADEKTLIIMDESHHMRNPSAGSELKKRYERIRKTIKKDVKVLLMTATPYSKETGDINAQLELLPMYEAKTDLFKEEKTPSYWNILHGNELSGLPVCVVLTAPGVVKNFSHTDNSGEKYVLFSGNQERYFPRVMHMKNVPYENICDDMLVELLQSGLLRQRINEQVATLFDEDDISGKRNPFMEAHFMRRFCSSVKEVDVLFDKMGVEEGFDKLRFEHQERLSVRVAEMRRELAPYTGFNGEQWKDPKIGELLSIIQKHQDEKIVIFCHYRATAAYVAESIKHYLKREDVEDTVDKKPDSLERLLRSFAPRANIIDFMEPDEEDDTVADTINILVATGSMAEGFNMQDASVMINFELPWTVLELAQRMGRILRPWYEPREIYVYTLIPSTMENQQVSLATNWKERLNKKNTEVESFSDIPFMVEQGGKFEMENLANSMSKIGSVDLNLNEVLEFLEKSSEIKSTSFIDDLALLDEDVVRELRRLPPCIRSFKKKAGIKEKMLYLLFKYNTRYFPILFDKSGEIILHSIRMDDIMDRIRSLPDEEPVYSEIAELDTWIEICRNRYAAGRDIMPDELQISCMMVLVP